MARSYQIEEIKGKLVNLLKDTKTGLSGVDISEKLGINRITMTKYLNVFAAEGFVKQKNIGNLTLWSIDEGTEQFHFPEDYDKVKTLFIENLTNYLESQTLGLMNSCLHSNAKIPKLMSEVIIPAIDHVNKLYDEGKIGNSERNLLHVIISNSIQLSNSLVPKSNAKKSSIILSADATTYLKSFAASAAFKAEGWNVYSLGDMTSSINVLFDLDLQKLLSKVWKKKEGVMVIVVFSQTEEGLNFFAEAVNTIKKKSGKNLYLTLCGKVGKKTTIKSDLTENDFETILQWSETVFERVSS